MKKEEKCKKTAHLTVTGFPLPQIPGRIQTQAGEMCRYPYRLPYLWQLIEITNVYNPKFRQLSFPKA